MDGETSKRQTAGIFDRAAATYDTVGPRFFTYFAEHLVDTAKLVQGAKVLDVATGSGAHLFAAAKAVGSSGHVTGVDLAPQMVARTGETAKLLPNADVQVMDAENLTFADSTFDVVFCGFAIFFFPDYQRALNGFLRVLKPGGTLALSTWGMRDERYSWLPDVLKKYAPPDAPTQDRQTRVAQGPAWDKPEGITEALSGAGFTDISITEVSYDMYYKDEQEWLQVQWSHGARAWLEPLDQTSFEKVTADIYAHLDQIRTADGIPARMTALFAISKR